ncbi:MAG TPA: DUF3854 domain-containing protein [Planctomycetota bacterium]|nr:DUF3854 domain-containing protein [Planctomycetota bacterium]
MTPGCGALSEQHAALLRASAISETVAAQRGYRTIVDPEELAALGFSEAQRLVPGLLIPLRNVTGEVVGHQYRPDRPRTVRKRVCKYESASGAKNVVDVPTACAASLRDRAIPLWITEGSRKVDAAVSAGVCCVGVLGVWSWRGKNEFDSTLALGDWDSVALKERRVYLAFDSDLVTNPKVRQALDRFSRFLSSRGAEPATVLIPSAAGGGKQGLDDFLAAGGTVDELISTAVAGLPKSHGPPYRAHPFGFTYLKETRDGVVEVQISNFTAKIVEDITIDDGQASCRWVGVEARSLDGSKLLRIAASEFPSLDWVAQELGPRAVVYATPGCKEHVRAAIQLLAGEQTKLTIYRHLGWREIDGEPVFLHAAGAISAGGDRDDLKVEVTPALAGFALPASTPHDQVAASDVEACLKFLSVAPIEITAPIFAAVWLAVTHETDVTLHLFGETGQFKTELAALAQRHFGAGMDAKHLPGSWLSTGNALEGIAFEAKDVLMVVDDFNPNGAVDAQRLHRTADRLIRSKANRAGRARMTSTAEVRSAKPPRCLIVSTGEDVPAGHSLRARILCVEVPRGAVDPNLLTAVQRAAAAGGPARVMAAFLRWFAPMRDQVGARWEGDRAALRQQDLGDAHRRYADAAGDLLVGAATFFEFVRATTCMPVEDTKTLEKNVIDGIYAAARLQTEQGDEAEPAARFLRLVASTLDSGVAHLGAMDGGPPAEPASFGWSVSAGHWNPRGPCIGWTDGASAYLIADASLAVANDLARRTSAEGYVSKAVICRRLFERGYLASTDHRGNKRRFEVRITVGGLRRSVLHLRLGALRGDGGDEDAGPPGTPGPPTRDEGLDAQRHAPDADGERTGFTRGYPVVGGPGVPGGPAQSGRYEHEREEP